MIACLDVCYDETANRARAAGLVFCEWTGAEPAAERVIEVSGVEPYQPGEFYRRELPCLLAILKELPDVTAVVVDGYVWLEGEGKGAGLGAHLYAALEGKAIVVGVAKHAFKGSGAVAVHRGGSRRPLWVSAAGVSAAEAAAQVEKMHGEFRIPTLLKRVDGLCRGTAPVVVN